MAEDAPVIAFPLQETRVEMELVAGLLQTTIQQTFVNRCDGGDLHLPRSRARPLCGGFSITVGD